MQSATKKITSFLPRTSGFTTLFKFSFTIDISFSFSFSVTFFDVDSLSEPANVNPALLLSLPDPPLAPNINSGVVFSSLVELSPNVKPDLGVSAAAVPLPNVKPDFGFSGTAFPNVKDGAADVLLAPPPNVKPPPLEELEAPENYSEKDKM